MTGAWRQNAKQEGPGTGTFCRLYSDARRVLCRDNSLTAEAVAERCGFSPRMILVDDRIRSTIEAARRDLDTDDLSRLSPWESEGTG